jgi:hypothetical protein
MVPDSAKATHLGGIPRRIILTTVGAFAKLYATVLNSTQVGLFFVASSFCISCHPSISF